MVAVFSEERGASHVQVGFLFGYLHLLIFFTLTYSHSDVGYRRASHLDGVPCVCIPDMARSHLHAPSIEYAINQNIGDGS